MWQCIFGIMFLKSYAFVYIDIKQNNQFIFDLRSEVYYLMLLVNALKKVIQKEFLCI